ncbi:MAG: hypothetical protein WAQ05_13625, partial [Rubrivivax sp.]
MHRYTRTAAALMLAACTLGGAQAATLVSTQAGGQQLAVVVAGSQIAVDLTLLQLGGSVSFEVALDAADVGQWLRFNAVIGNASGQGLEQLQLSLTGASFAWVGSVTPSFGALASVAGDDTRQTLQFAPPETYALDLGAPFAQAGTDDWLLAPTGSQAGDRFTVMLSPVPEPGTGAMAL